MISYLIEIPWDLLRKAVSRAWLLAALIPACAQVSATNGTYAYPEYPRPGGNDEAPISSKPSPAPARSKEPDPGGTSQRSPLRRDYDQAKTLRTLRGKATYYGDSLSGHKTANGERYDPNKFTAAHKTLPFGTIVRVIRRDSGQTTYVKVNDRGPFGARDRIIDLSKAAARELEMLRAGVVEVTVEIVFEPTQK
jgi:rare lipoprotein A